MRRQTGRVIVVAVTGSALAAAPLTAGAEAAGACEVRRMNVPEGIGDGRVMDIEQVPGLGTVYYGSYEVPEEGLGMTQRTVVWYGAYGDPVQVGPEGTVRDIGFELTPTGLINGQSLLEEDGVERPWVQDLRSGRLTWVDVEEDAPGSYVRRINDRGEAAGTVSLVGGGDEARVWLRPGHKAWLTLDNGELDYAEGWDVTNGRSVVGNVAVDVGQEFPVPQGVIWDRRGAVSSVLASNPGVDHDTYPRLLNERGVAAGAAWYGDFYEGHYEAAVWHTPDVLTSLGLLPGGGYGEMFGQSEGGWAVGMADHFDPEHPAAAPWGAVDHSILSTGQPDVLRVLPSPWAVEHGLTDWRDWVGGAAHGAHTGLDQVGTMSHGGWYEDGVPHLVPTLYLNASTCGEVVPTTHIAFWEEPAAAETARTWSATETQQTARPAAYDHAVARERLSRQP